MNSHVWGYSDVKPSASNADKYSVVLCCEVGGYSVVQYSAAQYSTVQGRTLEESTVYFSEMRSRVKIESLLASYVTLPDGSNAFLNLLKTPNFNQNGNGKF